LGLTGCPSSATEGVGHINLSEEPAVQSRKPEILRDRVAAIVVVVNDHGRMKLLIVDK